MLFYGAMTHDRASFGFFVTTGKFTKDAVEFAATVPMEVVDVRIEFTVVPNRPERAGKHDHRRLPQMGVGRPDDSWQISPEALNNLLINNVTFSKNISSGSGGAC
jgi:hypothetical protein